MIDVLKWQAIKIGLGLLYILSGIVQVFSLGLIYFSNLPDLNTIHNLSKKGR